MKHFAFVLLCLALAQPSTAQPATAWLHHFDAGGDDRLHDVYYAANGDFVACGKSQWDDGIENCGYWVIRVNPDGDLVWSSVIRMGTANSIVETDGGDFVTAGGGNGGIGAVMLNRDGELIWQNVFGGTIAHAVIELKSGMFVMCGRSHASGILICFDNEGNEIWSETYDAGGEGSGYFTSLLEMEGGVVAAGIAGMVRMPLLEAGWLVKVRDNGQTIWTHTLAPVDNLNSIWGIRSRPGGIACIGYLRNTGQDDLDTGILLVSEDGNLDSYQKIDIAEGNFDDRATAIVRLPRGRMGIVGNAPNIGHSNLPYAMVTDEDGRPEWIRLFDGFEGDGLIQEVTGFTSIATTGRHELVASGITRLANRGDSDGLLIKLVPLYYEPTLLGWTPRDTMLAVLLDDSVHFAIQAAFYHQDSLNYSWWLNGDSLECDTSIDLRFNELGEQLVTCRITALDYVISIRWHVTVSDLFIDSHSPDTLTLSLRRGTSQTFSLDTVRAVEGDPVEYQWTLTNLDNFEREDAGGDAGVTVDFLRSGNYQMEGLAYRGESSNNVIWTIAVRSAILDFWPRSLRLAVPPDSLVNFGVLPFNPESDSLSYAWYLDGELIGQDSAVGWYFAPLDSQAGRSTYAVNAIVMDGMEGDTVRWTVSVRDPNATPPTPPSIEAGENPTTFGITSVSPNPFNSMTTIRYMTSGDAYPTRLTVHDLTGREVARLVDERDQQSPPSRGGLYAVRWEASELPAGIYLVRLESGRICRTAKILLVR